MIDLLGETMIAYVPKFTICLLRISSTVNDASKAIRVPIQLTRRCRASVIPCISELFIPAVTRVFELTQIDALLYQNNVFSDEVRQHSELLRNYYNFLFCLLNNKCAEVLTCDVNRPHLLKILHTLIQGCTTHPELEIAKMCFLVFTEMVREWNQMEGFQKYALECIVPTSFESLFKPHFDPNDPKANAMMVEVCNLHKALVSTYGASFLQVIESILSGFITDSNARCQFLAQLQKPDTKAYKQCLKELSEYRRKLGS
jgi:hypothetical protein